MGLKLEWNLSDRGGVEAECGGYTLHVMENPSLADMMAGRPVMYEWRIFRHSWSTPFGQRGADEQRNTLPSMVAAQEAAEAAAARLLAEDAGVRALVGLAELRERAERAEIDVECYRGAARHHLKQRDDAEAALGRVIVKLGNTAIRCAELEASLRWIPVTEGLPDENVKVLVRTRWGVRSVAHYHRWHATHCSWVWATMGSGAVYTYEAADVTHWRPLGGGPMAASSADSANLAATAEEGES